MKQLFHTAALAIAASISLSAIAQDVDAPARQPTPPVQKNAEQQAEKIADALKNADGPASKDITVSAHAGTVVLGGKVDTEAEKSRATATAEAAAEGTRVSNYVEVRPEDQVAQQPEQKLARDVEQALRQDTRTASLGIVVSTDANRVVALHGLVPTQQERSAAENVARRVAGVTRVDNRLALPGK